MEFHIARAIRDKLELDDLLFSYSGNVIFANVAASRTLAQKMNEARAAESPDAPIVNAGALFAMGLIDELNHALVARYRTEIDPAVLSDAIAWFARQAEPDKLEKLLLAFTEHFPNMAVYRGEQTAAQWLQGSTEGLSNREVAPRRAAPPLGRQPQPRLQALRRALRRQAPCSRPPSTRSSLPPSPTTSAPARPSRPKSALSSTPCAPPMLASPDSLTGQLDFIREQWSQHLGEDLRRVLLAIDIVREEDIAIWMRFNPPGPERYRHAAPGFGGEGFRGDEYVGFEDQSTPNSSPAPTASVFAATPPTTRPRSSSTKPSPPTRPGCPTSSSWPRAPTSGWSSSPKSISATSIASTRSPRTSSS